MFKKFIKFNIKISNNLSNKYPLFFKGRRDAKKDLVKLVRVFSSNQRNIDILEIGGIDRPILNKSSNYKYSGLDIEFKKNCNELYDHFLVQSIEEKIIKKYNLIFSTTLIEHVKNNNKAFANIYNSLLEEGYTYHYVPSKNHFYSLILRLVGHRFQKYLIKNLRPNVSLNKTGYKAYFHLCTIKEMRKLLKILGFKEINLIAYYKATEYFSFFTPLYVLVALLENFFEIFKIEFFASGFIISAKK